MPVGKTIKSIKLFFQDGTSDKCYNVALLEVGSDRYTVAVQWGRRGASLNEGTKAVHVDLKTAEKEYDRVVRQKTNKGYEVITPTHEPADVAPPAGQGSGRKAGGAHRPTVGQKAQLLNNVDESMLPKLFADNGIVAQQKLDGMRVLVHVLDDEVVASNRRGQVCPLAPVIAASLEPAPNGTLFDGEMVNLIYWIFDLLAYGDEDLREASYEERYERLAGVGVDTQDVIVVPSAWTTDEKRKLFDTLQAQNAEGIVFKKRDAPYCAGRPSSGGPQLKYKFVKTADVVITQNVGNAYQMAVYESDVLQNVGKVFAGTTNESRQKLDQQLANGELPVAEVKYLYATAADNLFQPVFVRFRPDKAATDCDLSQLVHTNKSAVTQI